jgi:hypothetical protein
MAGDIKIFYLERENHSMDPLDVISNLKRLFRDVNKKGEKYAEVWLSPVEFDGGAKSSRNFFLNVLVNHKLGEEEDEMTPLINLLKGREEYEHIWRIYVFDPEDELHCMEDEILIYG